MTDKISRRTVLGLVGAAAVPTQVLAMGKFQDNDRPPPLDMKLVEAFVVAAHGNLDKVKELLEETPGLLNGVHDWSGGDFEAAIGGAGHMGRRDIAEFLIGKGAKTTLFVHAMLGDIDVVRGTLEAHPGLKDSKGPHGISLKRHAEKGEEHAKAVLEYLESLEG